MKKQLIAFYVIFGVVLATTPALAFPPGVDTANGVAPHDIVLPDAASNSPVIPLGTAVDPQSGKVVQGFAIVHPKSDNAKGGNGKGKGGNGGGDTTSTCYAYMSKGAKWKTTEGYMVDPTNTEGLSEAFVVSTIAGAIDEWEDAADGIVDGSIVNIFDDEEVNTVDGADLSSPDGKNEVMFGSISDPGALAVTIVWGVFGGPPFARELVEWDQIYDQVDFVWSEDAEGSGTDFDFDNVATHEIGHSFGMGHPDISCSDETMHRFASPGEIIKRDLNAGDIAGIDGLY